MKNPIIAAALNFFLPGAGYIYVGGRKRNFGFIILISFALLYSTALLDAFFTTSIPPLVPRPGIEQPVEVSIYDQLGSIAAFLLLFAFAYDAYNETLRRK